MVPVRRNARDWLTYVACGGLIIGILRIRKKDPEYIQQPQALRNKDWERQQRQNHMEIVAALDRITHEGKASRKHEENYENKKACREVVTIVGIFATALFSLATVIVTHNDTMHALDNARKVATGQHTDTQSAIDANQVASDRQHADTMAVLANAALTATASGKQATAAEGQLEQSKIGSRPYVLLNFGVPKLDIEHNPSGNPDSNKANSLFSFTNYGTTPAIIRSIRADMIRPRIGKIIPVIDEGEILGPNKSTEMFQATTGFMRPDYWADTTHFSSPYHLVGVVTYSDVFATLFTTAFCYHVVLIGLEQAELPGCTNSRS